MVVEEETVPQPEAGIMYTSLRKALRRDKKTPDVFPVPGRRSDRPDGSWAEFIKQETVPPSVLWREFDSEGRVIRARRFYKE